MYDRQKQNDIRKSTVTHTLKAQSAHGTQQCNFVCKKIQLNKQ